MIYTFYSYKGGVGRSMAMANIAQWFYLKEKRVIMIDWDLEAPGIESYFYSDEKQLNEMRSRPGLIDMLEEYKSGYLKMHFEINKSEQEVERITHKLLDELQQDEVEWPFLKETLERYAVLKREEIKDIEQEIVHVAGKRETSIAAVVEIFRHRLNDSGIINTIALYINSKIQQGLGDADTIGVYLSNYALFQKEDIGRIILKLQKLKNDNEVTEAEVFKILSEYIPDHKLTPNGQTVNQGFPDIKNFFYPVYPSASYDNEKGPGLWLMPAGARNKKQFASYARKVQDFNWAEFYRSYNGEVFFEHLQRQLINFAEIVLIDSRTGISEMSGVSTRQLADVIIIIAAPNPQNLAGAANMVESFINEEVKEARKDRPLKVMVIPSRIDSSESLFLNQFQAEFYRRIDEVLPYASNKDFWELRIPYMPYYNYVEELSVGLSDKPEDLEKTGRSPVLDQAYRKLASYLLDGGFDVQPIAVHTPAEPYVGLRAFKKQEAPLFFGRTREISRMLDTVFIKKFLIVTGQPGSGKSSAIHAGLVPALSENTALSGQQILFLRPGANPFASLADAIVGATQPKDQAGGSKDQVEKLERFFTAMPEMFAKNMKDALNEERHFIVIIDQFEEIFTLCSDTKERENFINGVAKWVTNREAIVILSIRTEYYQQLLKYPSVATIGELAVVNLAIPSERELRQIIVEPAAKAGLKFEQGLVERMLKDLESVNYKLPLLQTTLQQLWSSRFGNILTHSAYDKFNGVDGILKESFESVFKLFSPQELEAARPLITHLVNIRTNSRQKLRLVDEDKNKKHLLKAFIDKGLINVETDEKTGSETFELVNDVLITSWPQLTTWLTGDRDFILWMQKINTKSEAWRNNDHAGNLLLNKTELAEAEVWMERKEDLLENEKIFLEKSIALRKKRKEERLIRYIVIGITLAFLAYSFYTQKSKVPDIKNSAIDTVAQSSAYIFASQFSATENRDAEFSFDMLQKYYKLDRKYQDTLKNIKQQLEENIAYKFYDIIDTFYSSLAKKSFYANTYFDDSVIEFGTLKNLSVRDIQNRVDSILAIKKINNKAIDSTYNFRSDSLYFFVKYVEKGNILIDKLEEYSSTNNSVEVRFNHNLRIKSFFYKRNDSGKLITSNIYAGLSNRMRIDLFFCSGINSKDRKDGNTIADALKATKQFNVFIKNFKSSSDMKSPYYVSQNEIRFYENDSGEREKAGDLQKLINKQTGISFILKPVRIPTPGILSVFICRENL